MAKDTLTLALNGDVPFADFAEAIQGFHNLIRALSEELGVAADIEWIVHDLQVSSAIATVRGECAETEKVERVVTAYGHLGQDLEAGKRLDFAPKVVQSAEALTRLINGRIPSIRFETPEIDATISSHPATMAPSATTKTAYGAIEGVVESLTKHKGLRFTLYDVLHDRAVACYMQEGKEELMREIWGKRASVEGAISREANSGRPVAIRNVSNVRVLPETPRGSYLHARGIAPRKAGTLRAEEVIRRLRDA